jgi:DNA-directed RNA polymerase subunit RPC12/RpoP
MTARDDEVPSPRCPYCQGDVLVRLVESDALPVDVFRCSGCGTQFNGESIRPARGHRGRCEHARLRPSPCFRGFRLRWRGVSER